MSNVVILRPAAEIAIKRGRTRLRFHQALRRNLARALERAGVPFQLSDGYGRIFLETTQPEAAASVACHVFGIANVSPVAISTEGTLEAIVRAGSQAFAETVRGKTYAVRARRQGHHGFRSLDVERELGTALNPGATVNLTQPEVTVHVEVLEDRAHLFTEKRAGACGLPGGVQGKAVVLMSGGFDSAVAAWRMLKRGAVVDYVFCNLAGAAYERMVIQVTQVLVEAWAYGQKPRLHIVPFEAVVAELQAKVKPQYWQVVLKRLFYRAAERVAEQWGAQAIVTGESLGQVSSQTLANLAAIDAVADLPVFRPLIGYDKTEIIAEARRIGTAALSEHIQEYCALSPRQPVTATDRERLDHQEGLVDLNVLEQAVKDRKSIDICTLSAEDLQLAYLYKSELPKDAVLVDCQPSHLYQAWHAPGAVHLDPSNAKKAIAQLDKRRTYVLYCTFGVQTPYLAELMQQAGYDAYAFEGGVGALRKQLGVELDADLRALSGL